MKAINKTIVILSLIIGLQIPSYSQQLKGKITDNNGVLPGATVYIPDLKLRTTTGIDGNFYINLKKEGNFSLIISYIGYLQKKIDIIVNKPGIKDLGIIQIEEATNSLEEVVIGNKREIPSQARALNLKRNSIAVIDVLASDALGKLPDRNAAEAVQRIQGVAVQRYHGEADQATVRGTPFSWSSTLFNGNRLPSSNVQGDRSSVLDAIPSELIQYVQVAKTLTPDMESDAIGGAINFITRTAALDKKISVSAAGGYNDFSNNASYNISSMYSDRLGKNNEIGIMINGAIWDRNFGTDSFDVSYNSGLEYKETDILDPRNSISNVMLKRYMGKRQTIGFNTMFDYEINKNNKLYIRGLYNIFNDIRPVYESYVDYNKSRFQYNYRYSYYETKLKGIDIGAEHQISPKTKIDWNISDYKSEYILNTPPTNNNKGLPIATFYQPIKGGFNNLSEDGRVYWGFDKGKAGKPINFNPGLNNEQEIINKDKLVLNQLIIAQLENTEHDKVFQFNSKTTLDKIDIKYGLKYRNKYRTSFGGSSIVYKGIGDTLSNLKTTNFPIGNGYFKQLNNDLSSFIVNPLTKEQLFDLFSSNYLNNNNFNDITSTTNPTNIYNATENVTAGYFMLSYTLDEKWSLTAGLRNEYTSTKLNGTKVENNSPSYIQTNNNYNALLPMINIKRTINERTNIRAAYTKTFGRPNFNYMNPGESISDNGTSITINKGNENIRPTFSNNFDIMSEYFFDNIGIISGGIFYKKIKDVIFSNQSMEFKNGIPLITTQPENAENANLFGMEVGINKRFTFLNGIWQNFGAEVNYTYINSQTKVPRQYKDTQNNIVTVYDKTSLPEQSKHLSNVILYYEGKKIMARIATNFRGKSINTINQNLGPNFYKWTDNNLTVDASATYNINHKTKCFIELNNLTNEPLKQYIGIKERVSTIETYGRKLQLGIRYDFF